MNVLFVLIGLILIVLGCVAVAVPTFTFFTRKRVANVGFFTIDVSRPALNLFGSVRCGHFGTFGITSLGSQGAGITHVTPLLTSQLHYGMFDPVGGLEMRLSFDHRVLDGATAAQGLADMEGVLLDEMVRECTRSTVNGTNPNGNTVNGAWRPMAAAPLSLQK